MSSSTDVVLGPSTKGAKGKKRFLPSPPARGQDRLSSQVFGGQPCHALNESRTVMNDHVISLLSSSLHNWEKKDVLRSRPTLLFHRTVPPYLASLCAGSGSKADRQELLRTQGKSQAVLIVSPDSGFPFDLLGS